MWTCVSTQQRDSFSNIPTLKHPLAKPHQALPYNSTVQSTRTNYPVKGYVDKYQRFTIPNRQSLDNILH